MRRRVPALVAKYLAACALAHEAQSGAGADALTDILSALPGLDEPSWREVEALFLSPLPDGEEHVVFEQLHGLLADPEARNLACDAFLSVLRMDGPETHADDCELARLLSRLLDPSAVEPKHLHDMILRAVAKRRDMAATAVNGGMSLETYLISRVAPNVLERLGAHGVRLDPGLPVLEKLAFAGGLLGRIAWTDGVADAEELDAVGTLVQDHGYGWAQARFIAELATSDLGRRLDPFRLTRGFAARAELPERHAMLEMLILTAERTERLAHGELAELRRIAHMFHLPDTDGYLARLEPRHGV